MADKLGMSGNAADQHAALDAQILALYGNGFDAQLDGVDYDSQDARRRGRNMSPSTGRASSSNVSPSSSYNYKGKAVQRPKQSAKHNYYKNISFEFEEDNQSQGR